MKLFRPSLNLHCPPERIIKIHGRAVLFASDRQELEMIDKDSLTPSAQAALGIIGVSLENESIIALEEAWLHIPGARVPGCDIGRLKSSLTAAQAYRNYEANALTTAAYAGYTARVYYKQAQDEYQHIVKTMGDLAQEGHAESLAALTRIEQIKGKLTEAKARTSAKVEESYEAGVATAGNLEERLITALRVMQAQNETIHRLQQELVEVRARLPSSEDMPSTTSNRKTPRFS